MAAVADIPTYSPAQIAGFYAAMMKSDYVTKDQFNKNFFESWRDVMTHDERKLIRDIKHCDFSLMTVRRAGQPPC